METHDTGASTQASPSQESQDEKAPKVKHASREERTARGKEARKQVPRESHAEFSPEVRLDPIDLLEEQAKSRIPELVPIRYGRMGVSPFTFYRGAALIMAADLASTPDSGLHVQLCGDAHLSNFGMFASPERRLMFDINDFDETSVGPWEWDVKRSPASSTAERPHRAPDRANRRTPLQWSSEMSGALVLRTPLGGVLSKPP